MTTAKIVAEVLVGIGVILTGVGTWRTVASLRHLQRVIDDDLVVPQALPAPALAAPSIEELGARVTQLRSDLDLQRVTERLVTRRETALAVREHARGMLWIVGGFVVGSAGTVTLLFT